MMLERGIAAHGTSTNSFVLCYPEKTPAIPLRPAPPHPECLRRRGGSGPAHPSAGFKGVIPLEEGEFHAVGSEHAQCCSFFFLVFFDWEPVGGVRR